MPRFIKHEWKSSVITNKQAKLEQQPHVAYPQASNFSSLSHLRLFLLQLLLLLLSGSEPEAATTCRNQKEILLESDRRTTSEYHQSTI